MRIFMHRSKAKCEKRIFPYGNMQFFIILKKLKKNKQRLKTSYLNFFFSIPEAIY